MILQFILETEIISVLLSHISRFIVIIHARDRKEILRNLIMRFYLLDKVLVRHVSSVVVLALEGLLTSS